MRKPQTSNSQHQQPQKSTNQVLLSQHNISELYQLAEQAYKEQEASTNADQLLNYMINRGTLNDKLSALHKQISESPATSYRYVQVMLGYCRNKLNRKEAMAACQAMKDVFVETFLPKGKLSNFSESVGERIKASKKNKALVNAPKQALSQMYLEHKIKYAYIEYLRALDELLTENLFFIKKQCMTILVQLARFSELQNTVLSSLVNKFGDSDMKLVNELTKLIRQEVSLDFELVGPLIKNLEEVLFRKHISKHAQFYCVNLLSNLNIKLFHEKQLNSLIELYFKLFKKLVIGIEGQPTEEAEQELSSKLFLSVVKGLNRIFPIAKGDYKQFGEVFKEKVDNLYRIVHSTKNTKVKIQLLLFLYQSQQHLYNQLPDRYFRTLYDFLLDNDFLSCSLLEMFFDLLLISLRQDTNLSRVSAFIKRLLQCCFLASPNFIITCLILLSKLSETHSGLSVMITKSEGFMDTMDEGKTEKYDMFKRDPKHAHAQNSCLWELTQLSTHFHPTVRRFAQQILSLESVEYPGNPLLNFSLTNFIEKLCLRSERKSEGWKIKNKRILGRVRPSKYETLLQRPVETLGDDEKFLEKYIKRKQKIHANRKKTKQAEGDDIEEFADKVVEKQMERLEGGQADDDMEFDDDYEDADDDEDELEDINEGDFNEEDMDGQGDLEEDMDEPNEFDEQDQQGLYDDQFGSEDEDDEMEGEEQSEEKDFTQVFNDIGREERDQKVRRRSDKKEKNKRPAEGPKKLKKITKKSHQPKQKPKRKK